MRLRIFIFLLLIIAALVTSQAYPRNIDSNDYSIFEEVTERNKRSQHDTTTWSNRQLVFATTKYDRQQHYTITYDKFEIEPTLQSESSMKAEISRLKTEIDRLKRTWYNGLLDSSTKLLHEVTRQLNECRTAKNTEEMVEKGAELVLKVMNVTENVANLEMNVKLQESNVTKIMDASGNDVRPNPTEIVVDQQNALFLPVNLGQFFPSLLRLTVTFSGLYGLDTRTFIGMRTLLAINFTGNKLVEISRDAFTELANLNELDLSHNNIEVIHEEAFEKNVDLEILQLNHNQLTAIYSPIFKHQKKLRMLFLHDNKLKFINTMLLSPLKALEAVDLSGNICIDSSHPRTTLREINSRIMDRCIAPVKLNCNFMIQIDQTDKTYCQAESLVLIYPGTPLYMENHGNVNTIAVLSIVDQKMLFLPSKLSDTLPGLVQLVVEKSQLTTLHKTDFKGMTSLEEIKMERNNISVIEEGVFDEVPQIVHLNLAYSNIRSLPPTAFAMLRNMKTLVLRGNNLIKFSASLLPRRNVIEDFQLQENQLEFIESKVLRLLRNADLIDLSSNTCIDRKYQKSAGSPLLEILGHIELECSDSEEHS